MRKFDPIQTPALYAVRDTSRLVYLTEGGTKEELTVCVVDTSCRNNVPVTFVGIARDISAFEDPRQLKVNGADYPLFLFSGNLDTGSWRNLGDQAILERVPLDGYKITLDDGGLPTSIKPLG